MESLSLQTFRNLFNSSISNMETLSLRSIKRLTGLDNQLQTSNFYKDLIKNLSENSYNIGRNSPVYKEYRLEILGAIRKKINLERIIVSSKYLRPLFELWLTKEIDITQNKINKSFLSHLNKIIEMSPKKRLSFLALSDLIDVFFSFYISLNDDIDIFGDFIINQLNKINYNFISSTFKLLYENSDFIFNNKGAFWLAKEANTKQVLLEELLNDFCILKDSEFSQKAKLYRYVVELRKLKPNEESPLLREIINPSIYETKVSDAKRLGHVLVEEMIDKLHEANVAPNDLWKNTILSIAKDPRFLNFDRDFLMWWKILGKERTNYMLSWLSQFDMNLFLDIIEKYTKSYPDKERMFKRRKDFLLNVFSNNNVSITRLFMGSEVEYAIKQAIDKDSLPFYTRLSFNEGDAIFYYQVAGCHVIEGVHNFSMRILDKIPSTSEILQYNSEIDIREFRSILKSRYIKEFGRTNCNLVEIPHNVNSKWIFRAVTILQGYGVKFDYKKLFSQKEFYEFSRGSY